MTDFNHTSNRNVGLYALIIIYITTYTSLSIWLLFDGWINNFSALYPIWNIEESKSFPEYIQLAFTTSLGSVLGGAILSFVSFHRYVAVEKCFDIDHCWGFFVLPLLSIITGLVIYSLIQGGLLMLSGSITSDKTPQSAQIGFTAIGCIVGYNWDRVATQLQKLSDKMLGEHSRPAQPPKINSLDDANK